MPELRAELRALGLDDQGVRRSLVERGAAAGRHGTNGVSWRTNEEKPWENTGNVENWENHGKSMGKNRKTPWENRENMRKPWKTWKRSDKYDITRKFMDIWAVSEQSIRRR